LSVNPFHTLLNSVTAWHTPVVFVAICHDRHFVADTQYLTLCGASNHVCVAISPVQNRRCHCSIPPIGRFPHATVTAIGAKIRLDVHLTAKLHEFIGAELIETAHSRLGRAVPDVPLLAPIPSIHR